MTITTAPAFPVDKLLACAKCGSEFKLTDDPEPRYTCRDSCSAPFKANELNRLLIPEITAVVVTDATYPSLRASFMQILAQTTDQETDATPSDDEIRRFVTDPETFLAEDAVAEAAELLATFIERVELDTARATIQYALALPAGSTLAGSRRQVVALPESLTE